VSWEVQRFAEAPSVSHARDLPDPARRAVWVFEPVVSALVLGSTQRPAGGHVPGIEIEVLRRRSGGGAVLVVPGDILWVDVIVPGDDELWDEDIGRSFLWLGEAWQAALADVGVATTVHRGALVRTRWSDVVCFAGLGPGELLNEAGEKVVGLSQRRTREAARFQCAVLGRWDPDALVDLLGLPPDASEELRSAAAGVGVDLGVVLDAFLHSLT
jgi:lipoate---protein ligase